MKLRTILIAVFAIVIVGMNLTSSGQNESNTLTDNRDGNIYKTIKIGSQTWMAENLNYKTNNSYCYDDNASNCQKYGRLYTYAAAKIACPSGWHLPSDDEWEQLHSLLIADGYNYDGSKTDDKTAKALASKTGWNAYRKKGNIGNDPQSNNKSGFSALPGGYYFGNGHYKTIGRIGFWWCADEWSTASAYYRSLYYTRSYLTRDYDYKSYGYSVCLRD